MRSISPIFICFAATFAIAQVVDAQYKWSAPVPIDTSVWWPQEQSWLAVDDSGCTYVTWQGQAGIIIERSTDQGRTWMSLEFGGPAIYGVPRNILADHNGNLWLLWISYEGEFSPSFLNLSKSTDRGESFITLFRSLSYGYPYFYQKLAVDNQNSIYMLWDDTECKLTTFRNGDVAQRKDAEIPNDTLLLGMYPAISVSRNCMIYCLWEGSFYDPASGYHTFVFSSSSRDTGASFMGRVRVDTVDRVGSQYIHDFPAVAVDSSAAVFVSYRRVLDGSQSEVRLARSDDGGMTFCMLGTVSDSSSQKSSMCLDSRDGVDVLWHSSVSGTWHRRYTNHGGTISSDGFVGSMGIHEVKASKDGFLFATGDYYSRTYFSRTNIITTVRQPAISPLTIGLQCNYPNPFNSSTIITFELPKSTGVRLTVYDILGREVTALLNERKEAGIHTVRFDASDLSSGVYFYRLQAEGFDESRKFLLVR
jgi:hypothetical protein